MRITKFQLSVWNACARIPRGNVSTYAEIANAINRPDAARAVGNALNKNPHAPRVPCHRVVCSDGAVGGFAQGTKKKIAMLEKEGLRIRNGRIVGITTILFRF